MDTEYTVCVYCKQAMGPAPNYFLWEKGTNKQKRARLQLLEAQNIQAILCNRLMVSDNKLSLSIRFKISDK